MTCQFCRRNPAQSRIGYRWMCGECSALRRQIARQRRDAALLALRRLSEQEKAA